MTSRDAAGLPRRAGALALFVLSALSSERALAEPCGRPDVDSTYPPNAAENVPPNALLSAHYAAPADYVDEMVTLVGPDGADVTIDVSYDDAESMLRAQPLVDLTPGHYTMIWPGLRGVATSRGLGQSIEFDAGTRRDVEAPRFAGLTGIEWDLSREQDPCTESHEDRFYYDLELGSVTDDLDPSLLAVVVFETRGSHTGSAPDQIAIVPKPDKKTLRVVRQATGDEKICFAAVTRDLLNQVSGGGDHEVCVETTVPPFFRGCSVATRAPRSFFGDALVAFLVATLGLRRRARRA
jgi:hypothetical protein